MKTSTRLVHHGLLATSLALPFLVFAASPFRSDSRLDKRLVPINAAAALHEESRLRDTALARQANHLNSPLEARWNAAGQVQVYLHYDPTNAAPDREQLAALGVTDIIYSPRLGVVQAWVPASQLDAVAQLPGVRRVGLPRYALPKRSPAFGPRFATGKVDTQGDIILQAASFRNATGVTGKGIKVGVISDGDQHISTSQASGDLPDNIWDDPKDMGGNGGFSAASTGDEGTAMMEIVYDIAPGVDQLGFCGPATSADFVTCLDDFKSNIGANVIVDDLGFPGSAMFSNDTLATGVADFASANPAVRLVTAAGNDAAGFWEGDWTPMSAPTTVNGVSYTSAQTFAGSSGSVPYLTLHVAQIGDTIGYVVEWADPWDDTSTTPDPNDYDVVVFDNPNGLSGGGAGQRAVACNQGINIGPVPPSTLCNQSNSHDLTTPGPTPVQGSQWTATQSTYYLEVFLVNGTPSAHLKILTFDSQSLPVKADPSTSGSIYGHAALAFPSEISVGAVNPSSLSLNLEPYSSTGPVEMGTGSSPLTSVMKPEFVATDCVSVTGAGGFENPFCGTSAAAPHIAGLVALLMSGYPSQSPYMLLKKSATAKGSPVPNGQYGFGLPDMHTLLTDSDFPNAMADISAPADGTSLELGKTSNFVGSCIDLNTGAGAISYDWNFGTSGIADVAAPAASVTFNKAGSFTVTLKCADSLSTFKSSISVTVPAPPSSGGGGVTDLLSLLALGLFAVRRRNPPLVSE